LNDLFQKLTSSSIREFIANHLTSDPASILLNPPQEIAGYEKKVVDQIIARKKLKSKSPELEKCFSVLPPPLSIEQSTTELVASYKAKLFHGQKLVDLTGGMGADLFFLSQNFEESVYVEQQKELHDVFQFNSNQWDRKIDTYNTSTEEFLDQLEYRAHLYIDPARRGDKKQKLFRLSDCSPDVEDLWPLLVKKAEGIMVKLSPMIDISDSLKRLPGITSTYVISLHNEVKEVLVLLEKDKKSSSMIYCINLPDEEKIFRFELNEEKQIKAAYSDPKKYLYDPNTAILKAGAFNTIAKEFNLLKIAPNTHFYTSDQLIENFPGRIFEISSIDKKSIKSIKQINVISKNYPQSPNQLKQKYKLKDGGSDYLFAFRNSSNVSNLYRGEKII